MQIYEKTQKAHSVHDLTNGQYSRVEQGFIGGAFREIVALVNQSQFDGAFNADIGIEHDSWHMVNLHDKNGVYFDSVAVAGAVDAIHAQQIASTYYKDKYQTSVLENQQYDSLIAQGTWSADSIQKALSQSHHDVSYRLPLTQSHLDDAQNQVTQHSVQWDGIILKSHQANLSKLMLDMLRTDSFDELLTPYVLSEHLGHAERMQLDALMDTYGRLEKRSQQLANAMSKAKVENLTVVNVTTTQPFKQKGVTNVVVQFEISDGQTVSVWFNNPDANPNQISGSDTVVSWKWLLNSRDVTVALQPKNGENVNVAKLAERIMILVAKNSKRFASAQKRKGENQQAIDDAVKRVDELTQNLAELDNEINQLRENIEQFHAKKDVEGTQNSITDEYKARLESKDWDWLNQHKPELSALFHERMAEVKGYLKEQGLFEVDDYPYQMSDNANADDINATALYIDGGDLDWIFCDYNWDIDGNQTVHDRLDKTPKQIAEEIMAVYQSLMADDEQNQSKTLHIDEVKDYIQQEYFKNNANMVLMIAESKDGRVIHKVTRKSKVAFSKFQAEYESQDFNVFNQYFFDDANHRLSDALEKLGYTINYSEKSQIIIDGKYYKVKVSDNEYLRASVNGKGKWEVNHSDDGEIYGKTKRFGNLDELVQSYPVYQDLPSIYAEKVANDERQTQQELDSITYDKNKFTLTKSLGSFFLRSKENDSYYGELSEGETSDNGSIAYDLNGFGVDDADKLSLYFSGKYNDYFTKDKRYSENDERGIEVVDYIPEYAFGLQNAVDKLSSVILAMLDEVKTSNSNENQSDIDFLNDIIAGKVDVLADGFAEKIESVVERLDEQYPELTKQAVDYYIAKTDEYAQETA